MSAGAEDGHQKQMEGYIELVKQFYPKLKVKGHILYLQYTSLWVKLLLSRLRKVFCPMWWSMLSLLCGARQGFFTLVPGVRRAAAVVVIKRDLATLMARLLCLPVFTIDEWMAYVAYGEDVPSQGSDLDHCYTIYQLAMSLCPWVCQGRESFAQFLPWAREILHFIERWTWKMCLWILLK